MESDRLAEKRHAAEKSPKTDPVSISCAYAYERENKENEVNVSNEDEIEDNITPGNIFYVDRSKSGTSKCMECKKVISKYEVRIGKSVPYKSIYMQRYFHVSCAFQLFKRARLAENVVSDISQLDGVETLNEEEKQSNVLCIADGNEIREGKPLTAGRKTSKMQKTPG